MSTLKVNAIQATDGTPRTTARGWVNFDSTSTVPVIGASSNVSSITDNGVGDFTINFTAAMPDTNYAVSQSNKSTSFSLGAGVSLYNCINITTKSTTSCRVNLYSYTGSTNTTGAQDGSVADFAFFR